MKLDGLLIGDYFIIITGDEESRYNNILNQLITIPPNFKNEWLDRLEEWEHLVSHR